jgi:hypothetical protein
MKSDQVGAGELSDLQESRDQDHHGHQRDHQFQKRLAGTPRPMG